jgi:hypothetical protein
MEEFQTNKELAPHQQRVVQERDELNEKIVKLSAFVYDSPIYRALPQIDRDHLVGQKAAMVLYKDYLDRRIARFND